jgi:hypothetical protein
LNRHPGIFPWEFQGFSQCLLAANVFYCFIKSIHDSNGKRIVYRKSTYCLFTGTGMNVNFLFMSNKLSVQQLMRVFDEHRVKVSDLLRDQSISKQRFQNWKNRGIPANELPGIAKYAGISIDELMGQNQRKADRKDLHEEIDRLPVHLLDKARHLLDFVMKNEEAQASNQAKMARKKL